MPDDKHTSIDIGRAALKIAITSNRTEEQQVKEELAAKGIRSTAVDFGGLCRKREGLFMSGNSIKGG